MRALTFLLPVAILLAACSPESVPAETAEIPDVQRVTPVQVFLPEGDAVEGRQAFLDLRCNVCHVATGQDITLPTAPNPAPALGPALAELSRDELATSIIAPSHIIGEEAATYTEGTVSPMGDYTNVMTIRQLIDIVAFLRTL